MPRRATTLVVILLSLAAGTALGRNVFPSHDSGSHETMPNAAARPSSRGQAPQATIAYNSMTRAALRAEIRAALAHQPARAAEPTPAERLAATEDPPPSPAQHTTASKATQLVDQALSRGSWTAEDGHALAQLASNMRGVDYHNQMVRLSAAVNRGELLPDDIALF